eukprot:UN01174
MKQGWERLGFEFDDEQAQTAFNLVDTDRSGHISKGEFQNWVEDFLLAQFIDSQPVPSVPNLKENNSTIDEVIAQFPFPSILKRKTIEKLTQFLNDENSLDFRMVLDKNERYALHVWTSTVQNFTTFALRAHAYDVTNPAAATSENDIETHSTAKSTATKKTANIGGTVTAPEDNRVLVIEKLDKRTVQSLNQLRPKLQPAQNGVPVAFCASPALIAFYKTSAASNRFAALFEQVADSTGLLSLDGMQKFAKDYHLALSPSQVKFTFFSFDADRDHYLNQQDLELLLRSLVDCSSFDESNSMPFTSQRGSLNQKEESQPLLGANGYQTFDKSVEDEEDEEDEDDDEDHDGELDKMSFAALVRTALTYIVVGTLVVLLFSDPFVDVLVEVGVKLKIDAFYISFLISPLASNASEFVSSLKFAMKKTDISLGMTLSSLFGAATMNNTLALSIFCGLIYFRNLPWENSAECITLLCTITLVGLLSRKQTYPLWKAIALFSLLPISLTMIYVLNNHVKL